MSARKYIATQIVDKIIEDMEGRNGLGDMWNELDEDTKEEIRETWISLAVNTLYNTIS